jgi:hypothetical protein
MLDLASTTIDFGVVTPYVIIKPNGIEKPKLEI